MALNDDMMKKYEIITGKKYKEEKKKKKTSLFPEWIGEETNNIAPTKKKWFKGSQYFDNGYDFGDVTKTILSTSGDVLKNIGEGFLNTTEGVADTLRTGFGEATKGSANVQAAVWDFLGNEAYANKLRKAGEQVKDYTYKNAQMDVTGAILGKNNDLGIEGWTNKIDEGSVLGTVPQSVAQGIGNIGAFVGLGALTGGSTMATFGNSFASAYGNTLTNGLRNGLDEKEAKGQAITSGLAEAISEQFFQGIPGLKSAGWADNLISKPIGKYFSGATGKVALKVFDSLGEGFEEVISNVLQSTFEGIRKGDNVKQIWNDATGQITNEETRDAFVSALISSALTNGGSALITNAQKNQIIDAYAKEHDMTTKETKDLFNSIVEKKANLEETKNYKDKVELEENLSKELVNDLKTNNNLDLNELFNQTPSNKSEMQFTLNETESKKINQNDIELANSLTKSGFNNTEKSHNMYALGKMMQDGNKSLNVRFINNNDLPGLGIKNIDTSKTTVNGFKLGNTLYINMDGARAFETTIGHELGEAIKSADNESYTQLKNLVKEVFPQEDLSEYTKTYTAEDGTMLTNSVEDEWVNDRLGELFENENLRNRIADNRTVLQKIIDNIKSIYNKVTGKDKQKIKTLKEQLEDKFVELYKETDFSKAKNKNRNTAFSLQQNINELTPDGITMTYVRNPNSNAKQYNFGNQYGQNLEPAGEYMNMDTMQGKNKIEGLEYGTIRFNNPLVIDNTDTTANGWKKILSDKYNGLTGKKLSNAIKNDGYDAVMTRDENGNIWEVVNLNGVKQNNEDIRFSLATNKDNTGRTLTPQQQEYFKDSAIRVAPGEFGMPRITENGQLFEVYHGTNNDFTVFDKNYFGSANDMGWYGPGFYFAFTEGEARTYGSKVIKSYLNIKNPFFFSEEMQSYDGQDSGDVNFDYGSFMINMKNKFPDISSRETLKYAEYSNETGDLETKEVSIKDVGNKIEEIYNSKDLKMITIDDNGVEKYQYVYQNDINDYNVPNDIKTLVENNHIYNKGDASFAVENSKYYNATTEELQKLLDYFNKTNNDFSRTYIGYPVTNKQVMENSRLTEATWYVVNNVYHNLERHMPEYYMQYLGNDIQQELINKGYDGVVQSRGGDEIVAFYPNQIKNVDNTNPTDNPDIRFSLTPLNELDPKKEYYFRGQTNNEQKIAYNNTQFQGNTEGGVFVTPDRKTAEKYGKNVLAIEKTKDNTVSVEESNKLFEWASKVVQDDLNNQRESDYVVEQMALSRPRAFAEYTGKPFVETGDMFGEPGEAIYYQEVADGTSTYGTDDYSLTSNDNINKIPTKDDLTYTKDVELAPIREDISNLTKQVENLSKQLETAQNRTEIAPTGYVEEYKEGRNENRNSRPLTEEDANLYQESLMNNEDYLRSLDEQANATENNLKLINRTTNEVQQKLGLSKNEKGKLENIVRKAVENNMTTDEIANELSNEFSSIEYTTPNYEAREVKKLIKNTPLKVSDAIKKDIADYGDFQRRNFNKISISKNGIPVDVAYESLTQQNPGYFPSDIINPTDQLLRIVEVANFTNDLTETYEFSQDDIDDAADYITNNILEDKYNSQMSADADLQKGIEFNFDNEIAPTTIRSQESIDNTIENRDIAPVREEQPFRQTLKGEEKKAQRKINLENTWRKFQETAVNRNYVIDKLAKATGNDDIKFTGDMLNSYSGEVNFNVNNWQTNMKGEEVGKSIKDIFEPAKKTGLYAPFNDYLIQKSNIERHAVGKGSQIPLVVSQQLVSQYETEYPQFKEWSKDVFKYLDNVLQDQVDYGIITQEQYDNYRGENGIYRSYVPFYEANYDAKRYFDDNGEVKPASTLKRSKGGAKDTSSMLAVEDALVRQTFAYKQAIRQNELLKEIVKTHEKYDNMMDLDTRLNPTDLNDSLYTTEDGDKIVTAYINGERVSAKVSDELFNELTRENENRVKQFEEDFSIVTKPIQKISSIRRNLLTTWNPTFLARNAIKDIQDAVINSKHTTGMLKNYLPGIKELTQAKTKEAKQFLALYGSENLYGDYSNVSNSKKLANKIIRANEIIELAPRFAEFKASLQAGESLEQAMYNAREVTTNFGRGGYITKALNRNGFTFLNANVQGLDKAIRNLTGQNGVKGVTAMVVKGAIFSILPSLLNDMLYGGDDDDKDEEYEALSTYIKDNYYLIKLEDGNFLRIPKGRLSAAFGSGARRLEELSKGDKDALKGWASNAWEQIGVGDLGGNNILAPIKQAFGSKNGTAWYGGDIVPTRLQKKPNAEQSDEKTDAISKFLGETLGISPKKINYVFDQYSGGLGDIFLPMITPASSNGADSLGEYLLAPIKDSFVVNSTDDNKYAGKFYDKSDELQIKANSDYATDEDKLKSKYMSDISSEMTKLYTEKREIQMDNSLSKKEKYAKVQVIQNEINNTAKKAMDNYEKVNQTDGYANVGGNEYYKNANDKWATVSESDAEFTAGLSDKEKSYYYDTKNKIYNIKGDYNKKVEGVTDSSIKNKYYSEKKKNITNAIKNSGLNDYTKAMLYGNNYLGKEKMNNVYNAGYDINDYITAMYKIEQIRDKYSQNNGYTTQQRKQKTIAYINSLNMNVPEKAMLIRQYYTSFRDYNKKIVNYVADLDLTYEEKIAILNDTGMSVKGNRVTWK